MGGGGKGGSQNSSQSVKVKLDPELKEAALKVMQGGFGTAGLPFQPYPGPTVAGLAPQEMAAFEGANQAASAFGLPAGSTIGYLPDAGDFGGFQGYSPSGILTSAIDAQDPDYKAMREALRNYYKGEADEIFTPPATQAPEQNTGSGLSAQERNQQRLYKQQVMAGDVPYVPGAGGMWLSPMARRRIDSRGR